MEHRQFSHLIAAIDTGQIALAAEREQLTPQAISKSIARLEAAVGGPLLHRTAKGVAPTKLAQRLLPHARTIVAEMQALGRVADSELARQSGRLRIGVGPVAATGPLTARLIAFTHRYPQVHIDVVAGIDRDFRAQLLEGKIDLAFASDLNREEVDDRFLQHRPCGSETWLIAGREGHPMLERARSLADLAGARWLVGRNTAALDALIAMDFEQAGLTLPRPSLSTTSLPFAHEVLRQSDYLGILPQGLVQGWAGVAGRDLVGGRWVTPLHMVRRARSTADPLIEELAATLA